MNKVLAVATLMALSAVALAENQRSFGLEVSLKPRPTWILRLRGTGDEPRIWGGDLRTTHHRKNGDTRDGENHQWRFGLRSEGFR